jgi:hypothetical protein
VPLNLLEELHRHREHHVRQINTVNMAATVGLAGLVLAVILSDKAPHIVGAAARPLAWSALELLAAGAVMLFAAAYCHWRFHSARVYVIDGLIGQYLFDPTQEQAKRLSREFVDSTCGCTWRDKTHFGLAQKGWYMYGMTGVGLACLIVAGFLFLSLRLLETS